MGTQIPEKRLQAMDLGSEPWKGHILHGAAEMGIHIDRTQVDQIAIHGIELLKWNRKMNLTAIRDPAAIAVKHFLDSLAPVPFIPSESRVLDIGSGGGFPGLPIKIVIPSLQMTLIDACRKKIHFLKHIIRMLRLDAIEALHIRAEELAREMGAGERPPDGQYDVVVCRAFGRLADIVRTALPLTRPTGTIIAFKGRISDTERREAEIVAREAMEGNPSILLNRYRLPYLGFERFLVCIQR